MSKKTRELQAEIVQKSDQVVAMLESDAADLTAAEALTAEISDLEKQLDLLEKAEAAKLAKAPAPVDAETQKESGFAVMAKMLAKKGLTATEKALVSGENAADGDKEE